MDNVDLLFDDYNNNYEQAAAQEGLWEGISDFIGSLWRAVCDLWATLCDWVKRLICDNPLSQWIKRTFGHTDTKVVNGLAKGLNDGVDTGPSSARIDPTKYKPIGVSFIGSILEAAVEEGDSKLNSVLNCASEDIYKKMNGRDRVPLAYIFDIGKKNFDILSKKAPSIKKAGDKAVRDNNSEEAARIATGFKRAMKFVFVPFKFCTETLKEEKERLAKLKTPNNVKMEA